MFFVLLLSPQDGTRTPTRSVPVLEVFRSFDYEYEYHFIEYEYAVA